MLRFRPPLVHPTVRLSGRRYPYLIVPYRYKPDHINRMTLRKIHGQLHYLAWHAPCKNADKWRLIERKFLAKHRTADNNWL